MVDRPVSEAARARRRAREIGASQRHRQRARVRAEFDYSRRAENGDQQLVGANRSRHFLDQARHDGMQFVLVVADIDGEGEFASRYARNRTEFPDQSPQPGAHQAQDMISGLRPVQVVDFPKCIDFDGHQNAPLEGPGLVARLLEELFDFLFETGSRQKPRRTVAKNRVLVDLGRVGRAREVGMCATGSRQRRQSGDHAGHRSELQRSAVAKTVEHDCP